MSIKKISDYTLEECQEYLKLNPNGSERIVVEERIRNIFTQSEENKEKDEILRKIKLEELEKDVEWIDIKRLIEIGSYRGLRHRKGLPVRGQRSKTNARTRKGPKKTIANKKK